MPIEPWGTYPPEVNTGRFIAGGGVASWLAVSAEWKAMAALVAEQVLTLTTTKVGVLASWKGISGPALLAALEPYTQWLNHMEMVALKNSAAADAVITAYTVGRSSVVPLTVINANRVAAKAAEAQAQMASATASLPIPGVNVAAASVALQAEATAAELEAQYAAMWGMDASVLTSYDSAVTAATTPTVPLPPPQIATIATPDGSVGPMASIGDVVAKFGGSPEAQALVNDAAAQAHTLGTQAVQQGMQMGTGGSGMLAPTGYMPSTAMGLGRGLPMGAGIPYAGGVAGLGQQTTGGTRPMTDSQFRGMLSRLGGGGGLRQLGSMGHLTGGLGAGAGGGMNGHGLGAGGGVPAAAGAATLGLLAGATAAGVGSSFGGVPTGPSMMKPPMSLGGGMVPPMMGRGAQQQGGKGSDMQIMDRSDYLAELLPTLAVENTTPNLVNDAPIAEGDAPGLVSPTKQLPLDE